MTNRTWSKRIVDGERTVYVRVSKSAEKDLEQDAGECYGRKEGEDAVAAATLDFIASLSHSAKQG